MNKTRLKVYFTAATSFDGDLTYYYRKIINLIEETGIKLLSGRQIVDKKLLAKDNLLSQKEIFERERKSIDQADCVVAEVSKPSLGVGSEITYALSKGKPTLALTLDDYSKNISPIIAGNPSEDLFLEFYNANRLPFTLRDFFDHVCIVKSRLGKLIVLDGADGSGKTTQATLLFNYFKKKKIPVRLYDFPQYYHSFHGKIVAKFLRGEFGKIDEVSPYLASLAYALDRASVKQEIEDFLSRGGYVITNRYATSNMAHQGAKFKNALKRKEYLKWIFELEYKIHKIPREDIVIYLYVPWKTALQLSKKKGERKYLQGSKVDIHEKDLHHRMLVEKMYLYLSTHLNHWVKINCLMKGKLLGTHQIHNKVISALQAHKIIQNRPL